VELAGEERYRFRGNVAETLAEAMQGRQEVGVVGLALGD
jgi:hypothetical protein